MHRRFGCLDGQRVHDFERRGQHAGGDDVAYGLARGRGRSKCREQRLHHLRLTHDAQRDLCRNAQRAFRADENAGQIVAGRVERGRAQVRKLAAGQNDFKRQRVRDGESVLEAVRAAGVLRHVAADGADRLRRGIGRVEVALGRNALRDVRVDDARLDDNEAVGDVDLENAVHARQADDDAACSRQRAAAQAGACAAADEGNLVARAEANDGLDLFGGLRQNDCAGQHAKIS